MQNVRELVPEDGEDDDENDRQEHHSDEIVHEIFLSMSCERIVRGRRVSPERGIR